MLGLGFTEILLIAVIVLVVVGPDRLPEFLRAAGRIYGQVRRAGDELRTALTAESDRQEAEERYRQMVEKRRQAEEARKKAAEIGAVPHDQAVPAVAPRAEGDSPARTTAPQGLQVLPPEDDPETPLLGHRPVAVAVSAPEAPPTGVSSAEWEQLPPHIRDLLRKRS